MILRYLLLLLCLGPILARANNNCVCQDYVIDVNQTEGMLKMPSSACGGTMCTFKILPKDGQIVTVGFLELNRFSNRDYFLKIFYYNGEKEEKDMIYVTNTTEVNPYSYRQSISSIQSPKNFGIYINFTANFNIPKMWTQIKFARLPPDRVSHNCPSPYFKAELEPQVIDPTFWPSSGCAVRFSADWEAEIHSIQVFMHCNDSERVHSWKRFVNPIGISEHINRKQEENRKREEGASKKEIYKDTITARYWEVMTKDFEMFMKIDFYSISSNELYGFDGKRLKLCHLKYFSTTTNPCVCPTYNTTVYFDQPLNLTSPGYPSLNCPGIVCIYNITMGEKKSADYNAVFIITASHIPQSFHDTLLVESASQTFEMNYERERNQLMTIFEERFDVEYAGSSSMVENHGFSMKIEAIKLPKDCVCPASGELSMKGNFSLTMPSHCPRISCRYILKKNSGISGASLRVHLTYRLPDASEFLVFDVEDRKVFIPGGASDWEHDAFTIFIPLASMRKIWTNMHYIRKGSEERDGERGEMESSFSMSWEWLSADDCSCGLKEMTATAEKWSAIFSPYWPGQYCSNLNCTTKIYAPEGHRIIFNFTEFETESADFVTIYENFNKTKILTRLSGRLARKHGEATNSNEAIFNFKTDSQGEARGFKVMFIAVPKEPKSSSVALWVGLFLVVLIVVGLVGYKRKFLFENVVLFARQRGINLTNPIFGETCEEFDNQ